MEMVVETGRGYVPASEHSPQVQEIGVIPVDAVYSPVVRVRYDVEETRVGQKTNYDKLTLEIWTNGSLTPEMALVEAAKILRKHLNLRQYNELGQRVHAEMRAAGGASLDPAVEAKLTMPLAELNLSVRATNCLESENVHTIRDLVLRTPDQLLEVRNFGETTLNEVQEKLADIGLAKCAPPTHRPVLPLPSRPMCHHPLGTTKTTTMDTDDEAVLGRNRTISGPAANRCRVDYRSRDAAGEDNAKVKGRIITTLQKPRSAP
jgi:hypothetical protein